jgi:hypothetical protein
MRMPHISLHDQRMIKATILLGLTAAIFLPPAHQVWVGYAVNVLWLWRL